MWHSSVLEGKSAGDIRKMNREVFRLEQTQPGKAWLLFREQRKRDARVAERDDMIRAGKHRRTPTPAVVAFLKRLRLVIYKRMKKHGGSEFSIIRNACLDWDVDSSGRISPDEFMGACSSIGVLITEADAKEVVYTYDIHDTGEMDYMLLVKDAAAGAPHFLQQPENYTQRLIGSARDERHRMGLPSPPPPPWPIVQAFARKMKKVLADRVRDAGGTEEKLLTSLFKQWSPIGGDTAGPKELRGIARSLGLRLSADHAEEIVSYFSKGLPVPARFPPLSQRGSQEGDAVNDYASLIMKYKDLVSLVVKAGDGMGRRGSTDSDEGEFSFTARKRNKPPSRTVEKFKVRLAERLEQIMTVKGGTPHSLIREAFLDWDADSSGMLDCKELQGALRTLGVPVTETEARTIVAQYDVAGVNEMDYSRLEAEIRAMSHGLLAHFEKDNSLSRCVRTPAKVSTALMALQTSAEAAGIAAGVSGPDMFMGTCMRFDENDGGLLDAAGLKRVAKEFGCHIDLRTLKQVVAWYESPSLSERVNYAAMKDEIFGLGSPVTVRTARSVQSIPQRSKISISPVRTGHPRIADQSILAQEQRIKRRIKELEAEARALRKRKERLM
jgi:Ca2+-binding EF-hand superfamily protein